MPRSPVNAKTCLLLCFGLWACEPASTSEPEVGGGSDVPTPDPDAGDGDVPTSNPDAGDGGDVPAWTPDPIVFSACAELAGWECGFLTVPVNYAEPVEFLQIRVSRKKALDPTRRLGVLLYNPGGPGSGGVERITGAYDTLEQAQQRFDFIGFDPRGTGASEPDLKCLTDEEIDEFRVSDGSVDASGAMAIATKLREGCLRTAGSASRLASITTKNAARDMDSIRIALGEEKLNYLGTSYGTWLGAVYATLFPTRVRAFVLDAGVSPDNPSGAKIVAQAASIKLRMEEYFAFADANLPPVLGGRFASESEAYEAALAMVDRGEVDGGRRPVSSDDFNGLIMNALYVGVADYPLVGSLIRTVLEDDDTPRILSAMDDREGRSPDGSYSGVTDMPHVAISCADGLAEWTEAQWNADLAAMRGVGLQRGLQNLWGYYACLGWPVASDRATINATGAPPMLVLEGLLDPATPFEGTRALVAALGNGSHLYSYTRDGHASYYRDAVRLRVQEFLEEPDAVTGSPVECGTWVRPESSEREIAFEAEVGHPDTVVTVERREPATDGVLESVVIAANGPRFARFTLPAGSSDRHVLLHASGPATVPYRRYLDAHRVEAVPPKLSGFPASFISGRAADFGLTQAADDGFIWAKFTDCDGLFPGEFTLRVPGVVIYQTGSPCRSTAGLQREGIGCSAAFVFNVPPGSHMTGVEYGNASYPGPAILVDAGGMTEVSFTPESN